jgi:hypothetical protein
LSSRSGLILPLFGGSRWFLGIIFNGSHHFVHAVLNFANLRMHFFDKVVFNLGQVFDAFPLFSKLIHHAILFGSNPIHPGKAYRPTNRAYYRQPERHVVFIHDKTDFVSLFVKPSASQLFDRLMTIKILPKMLVAATTFT